ncbi:MAG: aldehyde dehydrogenase family protein [Phycisphaerales bacterium]|nr:aldehyde dehydrogenase family protein [Phycisphaerales bacterium]
MTAQSTRQPELSFGSAWRYADAPDSTPIEIAHRYGHFIDGEFVEPADGKHIATINPATDEPISDIAAGDESDVDRAVRAARAAQAKWARTKPRERAKYLFRIARRIQERAHELAVLETKDAGTPIRESRDLHIPLAAQHFFYNAGWADKLRYAFAVASPRPVGVCGQIIPAGAPLLMAARKLAPALACGNTCILKPSELSSLVVLRLAEILQEVELPPGVVNIVTGGAKTGEALAAHTGLRAISFTGSTETGKRIARAAAETGARVTLQLSGKSPNIVFADASLDQAIEGAVQGVFFSRGLSCCAGARLLVEEPILGEIVRKLKIRMATIRVGDPLDKNTDVGPLACKQQLDTIKAYLKTACDASAQLHETSASPLPKKGSWCRPTLLTDVHPSDVACREEIPGPVLAVMTFRTPDEAIAQANDTPFGLAAGVWTDKGSKGREIANRLKAGVVWCNTYHKFDAASPVGGCRESGLGREGGIQGLRPYVEFS